MYNSNTPTNEDLPSTGKLIKSTIIAVIVAGILLITVVMPSEYGIDPTGMGQVLGLTEMGDIKTSLAEEAAADAIAHAPSALDEIEIELEVEAEAIPSQSSQGGHRHGSGSYHHH